MLPTVDQSCPDSNSSRDFGGCVALPAGRSQAAAQALQRARAAAARRAGLLEDQQFAAPPRLGVVRLDRRPGWIPRELAHSGRRAEPVPASSMSGTSHVRLVHDQSEPGLYAGIRSWRSREAWLSALMLTVRADPSLLTGSSRADVVDVDTFYIVLALTVAAADSATGRSIACSKRDVARAAGCRDATVQRVWRICTRRLGVLVEVAHARPLTMDERNHARQSVRMDDGTQSKQRGLTTLQAAHTPSWLAPAVHAAARMLARVTLAGDRLQLPGGPVSAEDVDEHLVDVAHLPRRVRQPHEVLHLHEYSPCAHRSVSLRSTIRTRSARSPDQTAARNGEMKRRSQPKRPRKRLVGEALAAELAQIVPWGKDLSPRRCAPALADYERAGWTAEHWLTAASGVLSDLHLSAPTTVRTPLGWIRWVTAYMTPDNPTTTPPQACGLPGCDGHGWIQLNNGTVAKCPHCPPGIRTRHVDLMVDQVDDEPPF